MSEGREVVLAVASRVPLLLGRLARSLFGMAFQSRRAATSFRRALKRNGVAPNLARKLTAQYKSQFSFMRLLRSAMRAARSD